MDFIIETEELQRIVQCLLNVAKLNTFEFDGRVIIEADKDNNNVLFTSNNGSTLISILSNKSVNVKSSGEIITLFSKIKSFVGSFTPWDGYCGVKEFHFKLNEKKKTGRILVTNVYNNDKKAHGHIDLKCFDDFGANRTPKFGDASFIFNSIVFKNAVASMLYSVDPNEKREFIQGVNLVFDSKYIYIVGSNGRLLSEYRIENPSKISNTSYHVKHDFILGLKKLLNEESQVFFEIDNTTRSIRSNFNNIRFDGKIIIGHEYPNYRPKLEVFNDVVVVNRVELLDSLFPFINILNPEDNNRLTLCIENDNVIISTEEASFTCELGVKYDKKFIIDVNGRYLFKTVDSIKDDLIKIKFSDEKGCLLLDSGSTETHRTLVAPIKRK